MNTRSTVGRIKTIQKKLGLDADGIIGPATLTAIENRLFPDDMGERQSITLQVSREGLAQLVRHEVSSRSYYNKKLQSPVWPGGRSGITIGIGFDLGYCTIARFRKDWQGRIKDIELEKLARVCGLKGDDARRVRSSLSKIKIGFDVAAEVFYMSTLPRYAKSTHKAYPGVEKLFPDAQAALLSLIYNRGASMSGSKRKEMAAIKPLVIKKDYDAIAEQILAMKRLWEDKDLVGLLKRRDDEAALLMNADHEYSEDDLVRV